MERVKKINTVMVCSNQRVGFALYNPYTIDVDCRNQNCYNYREFEHLVRNCKNKETGDRIGEERRLEYGNENNRQRGIIKEGNEQNNNLNGNRDLIVFN